MSNFEKQNRTNAMGICLTCTKPFNNKYIIIIIIIIITIFIQGAHITKVIFSGPVTCAQKGLDYYFAMSSALHLHLIT